MGSMSLQVVCQRRRHAALATNSTDVTARWLLGFYPNPHQVLCARYATFIAICLVSRIMALPRSMFQIDESQRLS